MTRDFHIEISNQSFKVQVPSHLDAVLKKYKYLIHTYTSYSSNNNNSSSLRLYPLCSAFGEKLRLYCPCNLDLIRTLEVAEERYWIPHVWKLHYIMTVIYRARWNKATEEGDFAPLSSKILETVIGSHFAGPAKAVLLKLAIIETDNHYVVGEKCKGYRFREPFQSAKFMEVKPPIPARIVKRMQYLTKLKARTDKLEHFFLSENLKKVTLDAGVERFFLTFEPKNDFQADYYERSVEWIQNKDWFFCYDEKTGRVFNNITSFPKNLRPFLRLDGSPLVEIDVANCQPFLLLGLYKSEPEREEYQQVVENGQFYEALDSELENPFGADRRKELKQAVFTQVFFDRIRQNPSKLCRAFARRFPVLFQRIQDLKHPHYRNCALWLQKQEADIVIDGVIKNIARGEGFPVLTVHDSVLTLPECVESVEELLESEFQNRFGIAPRLNRKDYTGECASIAR